ncbi:hypothetical protein [Marinactinospora rubrisoli]|uniref:Uncharacterized protein n=1 Tax=Marinactinospora rubrisoli TaxID=2715399 RepID=A0ABW2KH18_9ACTN
MKPLITSVPRTADPLDLYVTVVDRLDAPMTVAVPDRLPARPGVILDRPVVLLRRGVTIPPVLRELVLYQHILQPGHILTWCLALGTNPRDFLDGSYPLDTGATRDLVPQGVRLPHGFGIAA